MTLKDDYDLCLTRIDVLTERRQSTTTIYLSVNSAFISITAFLFKDGKLVDWRQEIAVITLLIAGILACDFWRRLIRQQSTLLKWWYEQLRHLEMITTNSSKIITKEFRDLYEHQHQSHKLGLTRYEVNLTWLFTFIYSTSAVAILISIVVDLF